MSLLICDEMIHVKEWLTLEIGGVCCCFDWIMDYDFVLWFGNEFKWNAMFRLYFFFQVLSHPMMWIAWTFSSGTLKLLFL